MCFLRSRKETDVLKEQRKTNEIELCIRRGKNEPGEVDGMQIMQSLIRQGRTLGFYPKCNWKSLRGLKPNFKSNLQC